MDIVNTMGNTLEMFPLFTTAFMSIVVASAFIIGSLISNYIKYSSKIKGDIAAFAGGIFFAAIAFSLIDESIKQHNFFTMMIGFILGTMIYSIVNHRLRKKSKYKEQSSNTNKNNDIDKNETSSSNTRKKNGSSQTVIVGTILDSIPETLFVGVIIAMEIHGLIGAVIALFLGNLTATLNGAKIMLEEGKTKSKILKEWLLDFVIVASAGPIGYFLVKPLSGEHFSIIIGVATGTLMIFITRELIPQAFKEDSGYKSDISVVMGFIIGLILFERL
jgi:zinc transporter, ZIP family